MPSCRRIKGISLGVKDKISTPLTKALMDWLEKQLGERAKAIRASKQFTDKVKDISRLQSRISNLQLMSSEGGGNNVESQNELAKAQKELRETTANVKKLTLDIEAGSFSTDNGVKANTLLENWVEQVLLLEKTKAKMTAQDIMRQSIDRAFWLHSQCLPHWPNRQMWRTSGGRCV